jgi:lysylphosphatidylglycerol synthetase-like protein (DUF2156 family)
LNQFASGSTEIDEVEKMPTHTDSERFSDVAFALRDHADNPSAYLTLNEGNAYFSVPDIPGVIAYREAGRYWVQFGGPFAAPENREPLLRAFLDRAARQRRKVVAVALQRADAGLYAMNGFVVNQIGSTYAVDLTRFSMRGKRFVRLRNKVSRASRAGLQIAEVDATDWSENVQAIDAAWLHDKGRHVKELEFLVGEIGGEAQRFRRMFAGVIDGKPVAYVSYAPAFGTRSGWLHDLSRRIPDAPPGVMEAINVQAITTFQAEGADWLHFGFTPFVGLSAEVEASSASAIVARIVRFLAEHGRVIYPAESQVDYKNKWYPDVVAPEYLGFHNAVSPAAVWKLLRITRSI